jgi:hypothetical protein
MSVFSMKKPSLRVTKWLGDIPVEGSCTSCPQVTFRAISTHHRPNQHEYQEKLIRAFDLHFKEFHMRGEDSPPRSPKI